MKSDSPKTRAAKSAAAKAAATARARAKEAATDAGKVTRLDGFVEFIRTQGVVGLAIGLVMGTQVKTVVDQLIASFINPFIGLVLPGANDLNKRTFTQTIGSKSADFSYGQFLSVLLSFLITAAVIYYIIKGLKLDKLDRPKE